MSVSKEMALADDLAETAGRCSIERDRETIIKAATALRSHSLRGEPVAWQFQALSGAWNDCGDPDPRYVAKNPHRYRALYASARPAARIGREATDTWAYIENLLCEECGLRPDEGLQGQRTNCINAIRNATFVVPNERVVSAAIEFLNSGEGLHKIRVNGKMMTRKDVARALTASTPAGGWQDIATIEQCAKIAEDQALAWINGEASTAIGHAYQSACRTIATRLRALTARDAGSDVTGGSDAR